MLVRKKRKWEKWMHTALGLLGPLESLTACRFLENLSIVLGDCVWRSTSGEPYVPRMQIRVSVMNMHTSVSAVHGGYIRTRARI